MLFSTILSALGGVALFILGLKMVSDNMRYLVSGKLSWLIYRATENPFSAMGIGAGVTAVAQSSVAVNVVLISLVDGGAVSFLGACAVVIGTNVGTTATAQLTSLSFGGLDMSALGAALALTGLIVSAVRSQKWRAVGGIILGFGLVFTGICVIGERVESFYAYDWFRKFFLSDNGLILLLNGFFITAVCQSSSVVSSMLVIFCAANLIGFEHAVYLLLGANIGTTLPVLFLSVKKCAAARRVALFNLLFNLVGATLFFIIMIPFGDGIGELFTSTSSSAGRAVANFHTFFNVASALVVVPIIKPFSKLCNVIIKDNQAERARGEKDRFSRQKKSFAERSNG